MMSLMFPIATSARKVPGESSLMRSVIITLFLFLSFVPRIFAQSDNASVTGFVQDSSKAYIADAKIFASNTDTGRQFESVTNKEGRYNLPSLPVGPYRLRVEKSGFESIVKEGLFLHTQDILFIFANFAQFYYLTCLCC